MDTALNHTAPLMSSLPMQKDLSGYSLLHSIDASTAISSSETQDVGMPDESIEANKNESAHVFAASTGTRRKVTSTVYTKRRNLKSAEGAKGGRRSINPGTRMLIYSGHDSTMVPFLKAIGLYKGNEGTDYSHAILSLAIIHSSFFFFYIKIIISSSLTLTSILMSQPLRVPSLVRSLSSRIIVSPLYSN